MPREAKPMNVYVADTGSVCYVLTASTAGNAREFVRKIRGDGKIVIRQIDQTKNQIWGVFPILEVIVDKDGRVDIARMPIDCSDATG